MAEVFDENYSILGENEGETVEFKPGEWVRPLESIEFFYAVGGYMSSYNTVQALWVSSDEPLTKDIVMQALKHLVRRFPTLSLCVKLSYFNLWLKRMANMCIDFDISHGNPMEVFKEVLADTYSMGTGPLWRARMVQLSPDEESPHGVKAKNHYMIVFGVQHTITDSYTNILMCREFVNILNNLMKRENVPVVTYKINEITGEKIVKPCLAHTREYLENWCYDFLVGDFTDKLSFGGAMPQPKNYGDVKCDFVWQHLSEEASEKLKKRCKEHGTSVHACIVTAINISFFKMIKRKSESGDKEIEVYYSDSVNIRRFFPASDVEYIGNNICVLSTRARITKDTIDNFWSTAKQSKESLHERIEDRAFLKNMYGFKMAAGLFPLNKFFNMIQRPNICDGQFATTNMTDITSLIDETKEDDPIQITDVFRSGSSTEFGGQLIIFTIQTFKEKLCFSFDISNNKISYEIAEELIDELKSNLLDLAETGRINYD